MGAVVVVIAPLAGLAIATVVVVVVIAGIVSTANAIALQHIFLLNKKSRIFRLQEYCGYLYSVSKHPPSDTFLHIYCSFVSIALCSHSEIPVSWDSVSRSSIVIIFSFPANLFLAFNAKPLILL